MPCEALAVYLPTLLAPAGLFAEELKNAFRLLHPHVARCEKDRLAGDASGAGDEFEGAQPSCVIVDIGHDHELVSACFHNESIDT